MAATCHTGFQYEAADVPDPDAELMLRAKSGDPHAFDSLVRKHRAPILRYVLRLTRDRTSAEDVTQEVFLRVYRYRSNYEPSAKFTTWLYRIASHAAFNWIRDHHRARSHEPLEGRHFVDSSSRIDEWLAFQTSVSELLAAVQQLPDRQRQIVRLHKFEELGCEEIAERMGCSQQAIRSTLCRAYSNLRTRLY
jgi:RNA polymerase sigma-70 factor (ECF subfamily)